MADNEQWKLREEFPSHIKIFTHLIVDHGQKNDEELQHMSYHSLMAVHEETGDPATRESHLRAHGVKLKRFSLQVEVHEVYTYVIEASSKEEAEQKWRDEMASDDPPKEKDYYETEQEVIIVEEIKEDNHTWDGADPRD